MNPFDYLNTSVKVIKEQVMFMELDYLILGYKKRRTSFSNMERRNWLVKIKFGEAKQLPKEVLSYVLRSYGNNIVNDNSEINFKLTKDCNFLFSDPLCLLNTQFEEGSIDSKTGIAIKDIKINEEIFGNYGNSSQIKLI